MPEVSINKRELERRSQDRIAVFNPTSEDFTVVWDGYKHIVPASDTNRGSGKGIAILPRYIAENYVTKMTDAIILKQAKLAVEQENKERVEKRKMKPMDAWEEQLVFERPLMTDNEAKRREILPTLWKGVVEQYGMDEFDQAQGEMVDHRPLDEQILEQLDRPFEAPHTPVSLHDEAVAEVSE